MEEADESELWLDILEAKASRSSQKLVKRLRQEASELRAIFVASRTTATAGRQAAKKRTAPPP